MLDATKTKNCRTFCTHLVWSSPDKSPPSRPLNRLTERVPQIVETDISTFWSFAKPTKAPKQPKTRRFSDTVGSVWRTRVTGQVRRYGFVGHGASRRQNGSAQKTLLSPTLVHTIPPQPLHTQVPFRNSTPFGGLDVQYTADVSRRNLLLKKPRR